MRARLLGLAGAVALALALVPRAGAEVRYTVDAVLAPESRTIAGTLAITLRNPTGAPLADVALVLYPNRFAGEDPGVDDLTRPFVYPREEPVPGGIAVEEIAVVAGGATTRPVGQLGAVGPWPETLLRLPLAAPLAPGAELTLRLRFRTLLPVRFGPFGVVDGGVTALAGWMPFLPALAADGAWDPAGAPLAGTVAGRLEVPAEALVILDATVHEAAPAAGGTRVVAFAGAAPPGPALLAAGAYRLARREVGATAVVLGELPTRRAFRLPRPRPHADVVLDAVARIVAARPPELAVPARLVVAEAPLRLELTAPAGNGVAVVSDRVLRVHRLLHEMHERDLAAAVYGAMAREAIGRREAPDDVAWITEGIGAVLADRYLAESYPEHRTVYDWIGMFNLFAIVDRFESAPKIPFGRTFFPDARHAEELRDGVEGLGRDRPPGRTIFRKLRNTLGEDTVRAAVARYLAGDEPLRAALAAAHGAPVDALVAQWTRPYPALNYRLAEVAPIAGGVRVTAERAASRPVREAVEIEVQGRGDERARLVWDDDRARATFEVATPGPPRRALLDPERTLLEDTRVDNALPPPAQVVLDSADVTVTSSEFGISGLFVARRRYDYTKDVGLVAFFSDRGVGMHVGPRVHFGRRIDATRYRHNVYGFYTLTALRGDFTDDSRPGFRTDGTLAGVGFRYDYTDVFAFDNPSSSTEVRIFGDWFSRGLGGSFDYLDGGVRASVVRPLWTYRTLLAAQVLNAFSTPIDGDRVPNQGRFSLGGDLAIRGIPVDERLGENVVLLRTELRQTVYPEVDLSLLDWLVVRRGQLRLFVDAGRVENRRSSLYRVSDFAVGAGVALAAVYDFMGFYPTVAYVAVARRLDNEAGATNDVQFLFGTRQTF